MELTCPNCSAPLREGAKFCNSCGEKVDGGEKRKFCSSCGAPIPSGSLFCDECGAKQSTDAMHEDWDEALDSFTDFEEETRFAIFDYEKRPDGTVVITGLKDKYAVDIEIPEGVSVIATSAFECEKVIRVVIPEGVKTVDERAFFNCDNLATVSLPASLMMIGDEAFAECERLEIDIPDTVRIIGEGVLRGTKTEALRIEAEERAKAEAEARAEAERLEAERLEKERLEAEERERAEAEARAEAERLEAERLEKERLEAEERERAEAEAEARAEAERLEAERLERERVESEARAEEERKARAIAEAEAAERAAREAEERARNAEAERIAAQQRAEQQKKQEERDKQLAKDEFNSTKEKRDAVLPLDIKSLGFTGLYPEMLRRCARQGSSLPYQINGFFILFLKIKSLLGDQDAAIVLARCYQRMAEYGYYWCKNDSPSKLFEYFTDSDKIFRKLHKKGNLTATALLGDTTDINDNSNLDRHGEANYSYSGWGYNSDKQLRSFRCDFKNRCMDTSAATTLYGRAANADNATGLFKLALYKMKCNDVGTRGYAEGFGLAKKAAELGYIFAYNTLYTLAKRYTSIEAFGPDHEDFFKVARAAVDAGYYDDPYIACLYALAYWRRFPTAGALHHVELFEKAADLGSEDAVCFLLYCLLKGHSPNGSNFENERVELRRFVDSADTNALPINHSEGLRILKKYAKLGSPAAKKLLEALAGERDA